MFSLFRGHTPPIRSKSGRSIASLEQVRIGGIDQWITVRGHDTQNPLLLYVHGGPGMSDLGSIRQLTPALEEHFTVVHWCQRGAGKSYSPAIPAAGMTVDQFVQDLEELARYVLARFGQRKLFLVGQSWGTLLCMRAVKRSPDLFHAYVGVNQIVDRAQEELTCYRFALAEAHRRGDRKAAAQLEKIGEPVGGVWPTLEGTLVHKTVTRNMGIVAHDPKAFMTFGKAVFLSSEVTPGDLVSMFKALKWNMELLWNQFCEANLPAEVPAVAVPVYFVAGVYDHYTSLDLAAQYLEQLQAPRKGIFRFEQSGHIACFEEPEHFVAVMLQVRRDNLPADEPLAAAGIQ